MMRERTLKTKKIWTRTAAVLTMGLATCAMVTQCMAQVDSNQDAPVPPPSATYKVVASLNGTNGSDPLSKLVLGVDGNLYGTALSGGANGGGTIFKITPAGALTSVYSFCPKTNCPDGEQPSGLVLANNGILYGNAYSGGAYGDGAIFQLKGGKFSTLTSLEDGVGPYAPLIQAANGNLYGVTVQGGGQSKGTLFEITTAGVLTTLYSFCADADCTDGAIPYGALVQAATGDLYGVAFSGGQDNSGEIYDWTAPGSLQVVHSFCYQDNCADGSLPYGALEVQNGNLYGIANFGAGVSAAGTIYELTPPAVLTPVFYFCYEGNCAAGKAPNQLLLASDGNFYGTTNAGGSGGKGALFELNSAGNVITLYNFCTQAECADGASPQTGLTEGADGTLYGVTTAGGANGDGVVFSLAVGLKPIVETAPPTGSAGGKVLILGNNLTGATGVTFNGKKAKFTVVSATEISATVPTGASTGTVEVKTPKATLKSRAEFRVVP